MSEPKRTKSQLALVATSSMPEDKKKLIPTRETYQDGDVIFSEGDEGDYLFVVEDGEVRIELPKHPHPKRRGPVELAVVGKGGIVGDGAVFGNARRSASAMAKTDCSLLRFTREQFLGIFLTGGERAESILRSLLKRTNQTNERYLEKLRQIVDLEERISMLELNAGWYAGNSEKNSQESIAAKTELERLRSEIFELKAELNQQQRISSDEITQWSRKNEVLRKRNDELEREQSVMADAFNVAKNRTTTATESADEALRLAYEEIEALRGKIDVLRGLYARYSPSRFARSLLPEKLLTALDALVAEEKK